MNENTVKKQLRWITWLMLVWLMISCGLTALQIISRAQPVFRALSVFCTSFTFTTLLWLIFLQWKMKKAKQREERRKEDWNAKLLQIQRDADGRLESWIKGNKRPADIQREIQKLYNPFRLIALDYVRAEAALVQSCLSSPWIAYFSIPRRHDNLNRILKETIEAFAATDFFFPAICLSLMIKMSSIFCYKFEADYIPLPKKLRKLAKAVMAAKLAVHEELLAEGGFDLTSFTTLVSRPAPRVFTEAVQQVEQEKSFADAFRQSRIRLVEKMDTFLSLKYQWDKEKVTAKKTVTDNLDRAFAFISLAQFRDALLAASCSDE